MAGNSNKTGRFLLLLIFFAALFSLRLIHLGADAPKDLDPISPGYIVDPGEYVRNARNKIVTGEWKTGNWGFEFMYVTPLPHWISYLVFLLLGAGIAQMNLVPAFFSCLILVLVYLILKKPLGPAFALLGVLLLGVNYLLTMFSRVANMTMPLLFFVCLTIYFLSLAQTKKHVFFFWAGVSGFICFTITGIALTILPSLVLGMLAYVFFRSGKNLKVTLTSLGTFALGLAASCAFWFWLFYWPHRILFQDFAEDNIARMIPSNWLMAVHYFWTRPLFHLSNVPIVTLLAVFFLLFLGFTALKTPRELSLPAWISGFWIITNYPYVSIIWYRPLRHEVLLLFPTILLATMALSEFSKARYIHKPEKMPLLFYIFFFFWAVFFLSDLMILKSRPLSWELIQIDSLLLLIISLGTALLLALAIKSLPRGLRIPLPGLARTAIIAGCVALTVFFNLKPYLSWIQSPRYDIRNISRDLGKAYRTMSIAGLAAPLIVMENRHAAYGADYQFVKKMDYLQEYHMTHLIIIPYFNEIEPFKKSYPEIMAKARLAARYPLWKTNIELWKLYSDSPVTGKNEDLFEGEIFFGKGGIPRYDPAASGGFAFVAEKNQDATIQLGNFAYLPGRYDVAFFLKMEGIPAENNSLARVEVIDSNRKNILALKNISGRDFSSPPSYRAFHLRLVVKRPIQIKFRVRNKGDAALFLDKVTLRREAGIDP